jgi:hypothetical protein
VSACKDVPSWIDDKSGAYTLLFMPFRWTRRAEEFSQKIVTEEFAKWMILKERVQVGNTPAGRDQPRGRHVDHSRFNLLDDGSERLLQLAGSSQPLGLAENGLAQDGENDNH